MKAGWLVSDVFLFPMAGYIVDRLVDISAVRARHIGLLWLLNALCLGTDMVCQYKAFFIRSEIRTFEAIYTSEIFYSNMTLVSAVTVFLTVKYLCGKEFKCKAAISRWVCEIGKLTYGVYLLHIWFYWRIPVLNQLWKSLADNTIYLFGLLLGCLATFVICCVVTYILRKIPIIRLLF